MLQVLALDLFYSDVIMLQLEFYNWMYDLLI